MMLELPSASDSVGPGWSWAIPFSDSFSADLWEAACHRHMVQHSGALALHALGTKQSTQAPSLRSGVLWAGVKNTHRYFKIFFSYCNLQLHFGSIDLVQNSHSGGNKGPKKLSCLPRDILEVHDPYVVHRAVLFHVHKQMRLALLTLLCIFSAATSIRKLFPPWGRPSFPDTVMLLCYALNLKV